MIYVECKPDFTLARLLAIGKEIKHEGGKGLVCRRLKNSRDAIGMADEDPWSSQPKYLRKMEKVEEAKNLKKFYDRERNNFFILICPRLEEWIIKAAEEIGVNLGKYGLPENAEGLHKIINLKLNEFERLLKEIKEKSPMLKLLKEYLNNP